MLSAVDADLLVTRHLNDTPRASHSRFVAYVMRKLAETFGAPAELWEVVGLCHDLDFFHVAGDWSRHGLMTVEWLGDRLPADARQAIAAHDHRTGVEVNTLLADSLKAADAIAIIDERLGRAQFLSADRASPFAALRGQLGHRTYLSDMLEGYCGKHALPFERIAGIVAGAPEQQAA
jgi:hypothetical protein